VHWLLQNPGAKENPGRDPVPPICDNEIIYQPVLGGSTFAITNLDDENSKNRKTGKMGWIRPNIWLSPLDSGFHCHGWVEPGPYPSLPKTSS
jgi:hypothetical protein